MARHNKNKTPPIWRRALFLLGMLLLGSIALSVLLVVMLRWVDPPTSAFMVQHRWSSGTGPISQQWVPWEQISPHAALAVVASEDQRFPHHRGFDFDSLNSAIAEYRSGGRMRGASTISQQTAKNLYLWPGRSLLRKGIEAYFTVLMENILGKRRILEIYLNTAQFGPDIFGIEAASQAFFNKPAARLEPAEAALLAAVLPNPRLFRVESPTEYLRKRQTWIQGQMRSLGGTRYLRTLSDQGSD